MNINEIIKKSLHFFCLILKGECINCEHSNYNQNEYITLVDDYNYDKGRFIGQKFKIGGMSLQSLYKLNDTIFFTKIVSIKEKDNLLNLKNEYKILNEISNHDNFCKVFSLVENPTYSYMITQRYTIDLFQYINRVNKDINIILVHEWFRQILVSFNILHRIYKIVHRDIKPENIMINLDGNLVIIDFGLSKKQKYVSSAGTTNYACPHMIDRARYKLYGVVDGYKCDIWSIGVVLFNIITRSQLYELNNKSFKNPILKVGYLNFLNKFINSNREIYINEDRLKILKFLVYFFNDYPNRYKVGTILIKFIWDFKSELEDKKDFTNLFIESMKDINQSLLVG